MPYTLVNFSLVNMRVTPDKDNSPEFSHALWRYLTLKSLCKKTLFLPCVKRSKTQPFTIHYVHLNPMLFQNLNLPIDKPTGALQVVILYYTKQPKSKSKTIKSKL